MAFFILQAGEADPGSLSGLTEMAERNGFALAEERTVEGGRLTLFGNLSATDPQIVSFAGGDFIATFGFLMYRGKIGRAAVTALYEDFEPDNFAWEGLVGSHAVVLQQAGALYLFADGLGACRLFKDPDGGIISNAFLPLLLLSGRRQFDRQGCYEYVFAGSCYGSKTLVDGISSYPPNTVLCWRDGRREAIGKASPIRQKKWPANTALPELAAYHADRLDEVLGPVASHYRDKVRLSLSGGFDSRLLLATLLKFGAKPTLFSYGAAGDEDVRIAKQLADLCALDFDHIDKSLATPPQVDAYPELIEKNLWAFDGWKTSDGIFSGGADFDDRLRRHEDGQFPINGSLGEIYRNFFYLPDRRFTAMDIVSAFYSQYDPASGSGLFDDRKYRANIANEISASIGADGKYLNRSEVEEVYPCFRGRYWTGHEARLNQRFGHMLFPYLEHRLISDTANMPLRYKDMGILQGEMIRVQNETLGNAPSSYGYALAGKRPVKARIERILSTYRPTMLRRRSFRIQHRRPVDRPYYLAEEYLSQVIDLEFPYMGRLFNLDRIYDATQFNSIATLEYIGQKFNFSEI